MEFRKFFDVATDVPKYGLKLKLNHIYPERKKQDIETPLKQMIQLAPLILRYVQYYVNAKRTGRKPFIDHLKLLNGLQIYGCPLGGIGAGTIGRGYKGEFCRFQLRPGIYDYKIVHENQFIVSIRDQNNVNILQTVLSAYEKPKKSPDGWEWKIDGSKCEYTALYPRAWTEYDLSEYGVKLICRQVSPIIPNNYKDSSLPCAVFVWQVINISKEPRTVSISFTWAKNDPIKNKGTADLCTFETFSSDNSFGISLRQHICGMPCSFTLAKSKLPSDENNDGICAFNTNEDCKKIWDNLLSNGKFASEKLQNSKKLKYNAIGISGELKVNSGCISSLEFSLTWDMPSVLFQNKTQVYKRFYTRFFGTEGVSGPLIASYALRNYNKWEHDIFQWQNLILENSSYPDWYKGALMNELYFISDGGTVWFDVSDRYPNDDPRGLYGLFGYLEGHEYRMYNTYDVHFYASFALAMLWPNLQVSMQYTFRDAIPYEMETLRSLLYYPSLVKRKVANSVPHDMGDPDEEPFVLINAYNVHDVSEWRDLNPKFILQVFRDFNLLQEASQQQAEKGRTTGNSLRNVYNSYTYLQDMYPICKTLIKIMKTWDKDNDGLVENSGFPDQTFDAWVMTGPSAYCGGLWLAALCVMLEMAKILGKDEDADEYEDLLERGRKAFEAKLWTGDYYKFDSNPQNKQIIMADQLCGQWYLRACGFHYEVFPKENVKKSLDTIYNNNVKGFYNGKLGACNGYVMAREQRLGYVANTSIASGESWTGVTYGLAALMVHEGKLEQAFDMAGSMYKTINQQFGMSFETPEAFNERGNYRSIGYMRPLSIWAMQHALNAMDSGLKSTRL